ncbi:MAG TPA: hypothetical protein VKE40_05010 [Gemmataceae bacterium]|nr:hypothetical protein [Gemmataceae bacterium]
MINLRVNVLRVLVPMVPLVLLDLTGKPIQALYVPESWLVADPVAGQKDRHYETRLIACPQS